MGAHSTDLQARKAASKRCSSSITSSALVGSCAPACRQGKKFGTYCPMVRTAGGKGKLILREGALQLSPLSIVFLGRFGMQILIKVSRGMRNA